MKKKPKQHSGFSEKGLGLRSTEITSYLTGIAAEGLALLRAVDPTEADMFRAMVVQGFDGVAVEDGSNSPSVLKVVR